MYNIICQAQSVMLKLIVIMAVLHFRKLKKLSHIIYEIFFYFPQQKLNIISEHFDNKNR
jgi:hypothetical protein